MTSCTVCRKYPPREGYKLCPRCTARKLASVRRHRAKKLRRNTVCVHCWTRPKRPKRTTCAVCAVKDTARYRRQSASRIASGQCPHCGKPYEGPCYHCDVCRAAQRAAARARKVQKALCGECTQCRRPATRGVLCDAHQAARVRAERPAPKRVIHCGRCGGERHNEATCPEAEPVGAMLARRAA